MKVLVTGASGFVGGALIRRLVGDARFTPIAALRKKKAGLPPEVESIVVGNMEPDTNWGEVLLGCKAVIHTAAHVHILNKGLDSAVNEYKRINTQGTLNLARQAADAGVHRFIFISSIGVNGNQNSRPFTEEDIPQPVESYALSKLEAELGLGEISLQTGMEVVYIRPPMVYGFNAPGNFGRLLKAVSKGLPLPLGAIYNKRSFIALDNLTDFIIHCVVHPKAGNELFLISDGEDVSTTELLQKTFRAFSMSSRLISIPVFFMSSVAKIAGKKSLANRLFSSLQVDSSKAKSLLDWQPKVTMDNVLKDIALRYKRGI